MGSWHNSTLVNKVGWIFLVIVSIRWDWPVPVIGLHGSLSSCQDTDCALVVTVKPRRLPACTSHTALTVSQSRNSAAHWLILQLCQISSLLPQSFCIAFHWILSGRSPGECQTHTPPSLKRVMWWRMTAASVHLQPQLPIILSDSWEKDKKIKTPPKGLAAACAPAISRQRPVPTEARVCFKLGQTKHCVYTDMRFAKCIAFYFSA